jgi:hypothetical protein
MPDTPEQIVTRYMERLAEIRSTGGATNETSYYSALERLLNDVGAALRPRAHTSCIVRFDRFRQHWTGRIAEADSDLCGG